MADCGDAGRMNKARRKEIAGKGPSAEGWSPEHFLDPLLPRIERYARIYMRDVGCGEEERQI